MLAGSLLISPVTAQAQQSDESSAPPESRSGECYAEASEPAQIQTNSREIVVREAYEIERPVKAKFAQRAEPVMIKDSYDELAVTAAALEIETENLEIQAPEQRWTTSIGDQKFPAGKDTLGQIASTGVRLESVSAGACFSEYVIDVQYEDIEEQVLIKEAYDKITTVPAVFETREERLEIREAYSSTIGVPAVFRTVSETVLVDPERDVWRLCDLLEPAERTPGELVCRVRTPERYETRSRAVKVSAPQIKTIQIPAVYQTVEVQRMVEPAREVRESVPAVYETVTKRKKVKDARFLWLDKEAKAPADARLTGRTSCLEDIPAQLMSVERQVVVKPAFTETTTVPAEFATVATEKLVSPASQENVVIPDAIRTESENVAISQERTERRQVLCDHDSTPETVAALQIALQREGFSPGPIDGILGPTTLDAVENYQTEKGLEPSGLTFELLESLGVQTAL